MEPESKSNFSSSLSVLTISTGIWLYSFIRFYVRPVSENPRLAQFKESSLGGYLKSETFQTDSELESLQPWILFASGVYLDLIAYVQELEKLNNGGLGSSSL